MRPTTLTLEGFQSYLEPQTIDLAAVTAAAVTGPVGSGKTTIIDAVVFALYGHVRAPQAKDAAIHTAAKTMSVELDFTAHDGAWRIRRTMKRTKTGFTSKAYLYLIGDDGQEHSRGDSSGNVTPTNAAIRDLIGLDYAAFRATSLIEQGRSGTFSEADPAQRHEIFANIIGLDRYAEAEKKARAERNDLAREIEADTIRRDGHTEALETQQSVQDDLAEAKTTAETAQATDAQATAAAETARTALEETTEQWHAARAAAAEHDHALTSARQAHEHAAYRAQTTTTAAEEAQHAVERAAADRADLAQQIDDARAADAQAATTLDQQIRAARDTIAKATAAADTTKATAALEQAQANEQTAAGHLAEVNDAVEALRERGRALQTRIGDLTGKRDAAREAYREEQSRLALLRSAHDHGGGSCYACGQSLDPVLIERMAADLTERMARIGDEGKDHAAALADAQAQDGDYRAQLDTLRQQYEAHQAAAQRAQHAAQEAQHALRSAAEAQATRDQTQAVLTDLETSRAEITDGITANARRARAAAERLRQIDDTADERATAASDAAAAAETARAEADKAAEALAAAQQAGDTGADDLEAKVTAARQARAQADEEATAAREAATAAAQAVAVLEAEDKRLAGVRAEHTRISKEIEAKHADLDILNKTVNALAPSGVPQRIMNSEIEVLNQDLDAQLSALSDGALSAALSTTRQTRSGTTRDELTLLVTGPDGTRPYETFSGGQKFLTDLGLHMALSKLLRDRRGAVIEALFVDEGVNALGGEEKNAAVRGIQALGHDMFDLSLTVTHDPDVAAAMPDRIEVELVSGSSLARII